MQQEHGDIQFVNPPPYAMFFNLLHVSVMIRHYNTAFALTPSHGNAAAYSMQH